MKNKIIFSVGVLVLVVIGFIVFKGDDKIAIPGSPAKNYKDATYKIEGKDFTLKDGLSEILSTPVEPGGLSKTTTKYFGNEVEYDLNKDGRKDVVFILTQNKGGSGTFYYVVGAINTKKGYVGTHALFLGDRIAPQTTEISKEVGKENIVVVNYMDRGLKDSFVTPPSIGKSIWLKLDVNTMQFGEVAQNFEGEADPSKMSLSMKSWNWVKTAYSNDRVVSPKTDKFVLTFKDAKTFSATTDCNGVGGEYTVNGNKITFTKMFSTLMYCEGSQEQDFSKMIGEVQTYMFTSKGELVLGLKMDSGSMMFR